MAERKKGQALTLDLLLGLSIAVFALAYFIIMWSNFSGRYFDMFRRDSAEVSLLSISDALVGSPGYPENWTADPNNVQMIGLARIPGALDRQRVNAFAAMPYGYSKHALGLNEDFLIRVIGSDGTTYAMVGSEDSNSTTWLELSRAAVMDGRIVRVTVRVYE